MHNTIYAFINQSYLVNAMDDAILFKLNDDKPNKDVTINIPPHIKMIW